MSTKIEELRAEKANLEKQIIELEAKLCDYRSKVRDLDSEIAKLDYDSHIKEIEDLAKRINYVFEKNNLSFEIVLLNDDDAKRVSIRDTKRGIYYTLSTSYNDWRSDVDILEHFKVTDMWHILQLSEFLPDEITNSDRRYQLFKLYRFDFEKDNEFIPGYKVGIQTNFLGGFGNYGDNFDFSVFVHDFRKSYDDIISLNNSLNKFITDNGLGKNIDVRIQHISYPTLEIRYRPFSNEEANKILRDNNGFAKLLQKIADEVNALTKK